MPDISTYAPTLRLNRSSQSRANTLLAAYAVVFLDQATYAWFFSGATIDLTAMQAGDTINIQLSTQNSAGGGFIVRDIMTYTDAQPAAHKEITIGPIPNTFGVMIQMAQPAGPSRSIPCDFYVAKRLGSP